MKIMVWQSRVARYLEDKNFYVVVFLGFLIAYFVSPSTHWHNKFFYVFIVSPFLLTFDKKKIELFADSKILFFTMAFAVYMCVTLLWADNPGDEGPIYYLRRPVYLLVFLALTAQLVQKHRKFPYYLFLSLCSAGVVMTLISMIVSYPDLLIGGGRLRHIADQLHNPVEGGSVYGVIVLISYFSLCEKGGSNYKPIFSGLAAIGLFTVILTKSRGPLLALFLVILFSGILARDKKVVVCLILIISMLFVVSNGSKFGKRIFSLKTGRFELSRQLFDQSRDSLILGKGISTDTHFTLKDGRKRPHGHNAYLGTLYKGGVVGVLLLLSLITVGFFESLRYFLRTKDITYFALLLFGSICIITGEDKLLTHPDALWLIFWLPLGLLAGEEVKRKSASSRCSEHAGDSVPLSQ